MKIVCIAQHLKDAIAIAERSTAKNQTLPILSSVFINAKNNKLQVRATNLETAIEITIPCKVEENGQLVVSAKILGAFLSHLSDEQIVIKDQKNNLFIKTNTTQTTLRGYSTDEFPLFPSIESMFSFSISSGDLRECLQSVVVATSTSDLKPELASVYCSVFKNTLKFVATDSFRLGEIRIVSKNINAEKDISFLIPHNSVQELLHLLDSTGSLSSLLENEKETTITCNKNQVVAENKFIKFISRLTEGTFPDYEQIIPKTFKTEAIVKRNDFLNNIKLASVFSGRLHELSLTLHPGKKNILFKANNPDTGEHISILDGSLQGEEVTVKFNWRYLMDGVLQIHSEYVILQCNGEQAPLLIKGKGDKAFLYLAMPMRGI